MPINLGRSSSGTPFCFSIIVCPPSTVPKILSKQDTIALIHALSSRKVHDKNLWTILMKSTLQSLNQSTTWSLQDLSELLKDLNIIKLKSDSFFNSIVNYIIDHHLLSPNHETPSNSITHSELSFLLMHIFILNGNLNNEEFFE